MSTTGAIDTPDTIARIQRRTVRLLTGTQILGGLGAGSVVSVGALLAQQVSGSAALSGMAATMSTLGAAAAAVPLARLARGRGRRIALASGAGVAIAGAVLAIAAAGIPSFPLLLLALGMLGSGSAVGLQARFAATDLAVPAHRGRDLSIVVWSTTIGAVAGPNLVGPGEALGAVLGIPTLTGPFLFTITAQLAATIIYLTLLDPDPLLVRQRLTTAEQAAAPAGAAAEHPGNRSRARFAVIALALSHATMVAVMAMTPVHLKEHGAAITVVGIVISLHIAGMYGLSPVFGILADRIGRLPTVLAGQGILAAALATTAFGDDSEAAVSIGLILLGLGWSASTVAASALLTESVPPSRRTIAQGRSDLTMNLAGATGGALAGVVLSAVGYAGLSMVTGMLVAGVLVSAAVLGRRR